MWGKACPREALQEAGERKGGDPEQKIIAVFYFISLFPGFKKKKKEAPEKKHWSMQS